MVHLRHPLPLEVGWTVCGIKFGGDSELLLTAAREKVTCSMCLGWMELHPEPQTKQPLLEIVDDTFDGSNLGEGWATDHRRELREQRRWELAKELYIAELSIVTMTEDTSVIALRCVKTADALLRALEGK